MFDISLIKAVLKGALTYIPGVNKKIDIKKKKTKHSAASAEFCYNLWLSILVFFNENGLKPNLKNIGELGSGGSFGIGICALLTGSVKYYALEIEEKFNVVDNLKMTDELVLLLKNKTPISNKFKQLNIKISNYNFPEELIASKYLDQNLISSIRDDISSYFSNSKHVFFISNWSIRPSLGLDFIFSRAVMEHVSSPDEVYKGIAAHLKENSYMFHDIEHHSHGITKSVNGHFYISKFLWKIIYGKRDYFLNRWRFQDHLLAISNRKIEIINIQKKYSKETKSIKQELIGSVILAKS